MAASSIISFVARRLEGKVALITGGASGIGKSTAQLFTKHGAKVVIADVQDELGHALCQSLGPSNSSYVHCNVADENHIKNAVDRTVADHGKLDIMFNNAGTFNDSKAGIVGSEKSEFERVLSVNVTGVFLGMKHAARAMIPSRSGSIISTASLVSEVAGAAPYAYTCSKHAVVGLTRNAAVELGQFGIRVNCVSPSGVATPLALRFYGTSEEEAEKDIVSKANLKGVVLKAEDVANAALFLASEEARYVSGINLLVDGGFSIVNSAIKMFQ